MTMPPTLFMLCGLPGSGKTTLARRLERDGARSFILDELTTRHGETTDDDLTERIAEATWIDIAKTLQSGRDCVLDWGFDSREERERTRARALALGAAIRLIFLDVPKAELSRRLALRPWPPVTEAELELWSTQFEAPASDEAFERLADAPNPHQGLTAANETHKNSIT
jgi:predicted kinase